MKELISKAALKEAFEEDGHLSAYLEDMIDSVLVVVSAPVKRGKWQSVDGVFWLCSRCHYAHGKSKYCPNCGAKMESGK